MTDLALALPVFGQFGDVVEVIEHQQGLLRPSAATAPQVPQPSRSISGLTL